MLDRRTVQAAAEAGLEVGVGVEGVGPDGRLPEVERQLVTVLAVDLCVGQVDGLLGLQDEPVEVEDHSPQHSNM